MASYSTREVAAKAEIAHAAGAFLGINRGSPQAGAAAQEGLAERALQEAHQHMEYTVVLPVLAGEQVVA